MAIVEFRDVYLSYNSYHYVFESVNVKIPNIGITSVVANPGSGKTSFLKLIKGIIKPTRGRVIVMGSDISSADKLKLMNIHSLVSIHFQDTFLISNVDVYNNLALPLLYNTNLSQAEIDREIDRVLDIFDIRSIKYEMPFNLSPSQAKLVSLARAFLKSPRIILLDEPFSSLDSYYRARLVEIMEDFREVSKIIFTTSDSVFIGISDSVISIVDTENGKEVFLQMG